MVTGGELVKYKGYNIRENQTRQPGAKQNNAETAGGLQDEEEVVEEHNRAEADRRNTDLHLVFYCD